MDRGAVLGPVPVPVHDAVPVERRDGRAARGHAGCPAAVRDYRARGVDRGAHLLGRSADVRAEAESERDVQGGTRGLIGRLETWIEGGSAMDELVRDLVRRAGLSEAQAKATAEVLVDWLRHE